MGKLHDLAVSSAPTFKCLIPSTGKTVKLRSFLVKEQKLLLMAKESEGEGLSAVVNAVTQLLQNCVLDELDITKLPSFDVEYMFVQLYMNSTASKHSTAHYRCMAEKKDENGNPVLDEKGEAVLCGDINKVKIELGKAKVPVADIKDGIITVNSATIDKIVLKYPTFDQMTTIEASMAGDSMEAAFKVYGDCLHSIYKKDGSMLAHGEDYDTDDAIEFLEFMSGSVFEKVTEFFNERPTVSTDVDFKCKVCGNETTLQLRGLEDFF